MQVQRILETRRKRRKRRRKLWAEWAWLTSRYFRGKTTRARMRTSAWYFIKFNTVHFFAVLPYWYCISTDTLSDRNRGSRWTLISSWEIRSAKATGEALGDQAGPLASWRGPEDRAGLGTAAASSDPTFDSLKDRWLSREKKRRKRRRRVENEEKHLSRLQGGQISEVSKRTEQKASSPMRAFLRSLYFKRYLHAVWSSAWDALYDPQRCAQKTKGSHWEGNNGRHKRLGGRHDARKLEAREKIEAKRLKELQLRAWPPCADVWSGGVVRETQVGWSRYFEWLLWQRRRDSKSGHAKGDRFVHENQGLSKREKRFQNCRTLHVEVSPYSYSSRWRARWRFHSWSFSQKEEGKAPHSASESKQREEQLQIRTVISWAISLISNRLVRARTNRIEYNLPT